MKKKIRRMESEILSTFLKGIEKERKKKVETKIINSSLSYFFFSLFLFSSSYRNFS